MDKSLQNFFTDTTKQRVIISHEDVAEGGCALYLPFDGDVTLITDVYKAANFDHPFFQYIFAAFGKPNITVVPPSEITSLHHAEVMAAHMNPNSTRIAKQLGADVQDVYYLWNDKEAFQKLVGEVLGIEHTTQPIILSKGTSLDEVHAVVSQHMTDKGVVLRVPDTRVAEGGGDGVRFVHHVDDIKQAHHSMKGVVADSVLQTRVMLEHKIPYIASPSTTYFIGKHGVTPLSINSQILEAGKFIAGTNILPDELQIYEQDLREKGMQLAQKAYETGARGFIGFDWVIGEKMIAIEANYRETGATIPEIVADRANHFAEGTGWAQWLHIISLHYTNETPDITAVLHTLREKDMLFEGIEKSGGFLTPRAVPSYAMQKDEYDLVFFWKKGSMPHGEAFAAINNMLEALGVTVRVALPEIEKL